ncbi:MAG: type II toxin-antitoxin system RelE/ParE family toxin [Planctomycetes bacterium]|nr:type II toxin-antitoxin system RelE/ParE family toxin [Planctomycetota bacterium]
MARPVTVRPEFWQDLLQQSDWYEAQQPGLGREFEQEVRTVIGGIANAPMMYRAYKGDLRRVLVTRFPHYVVYVASETFVVFLGLVHAAREFEAWLERRQSP